jgi:hypothetical protein
MNLEDTTKTKYYSEKREMEFYKEIEEMNLTHEIYTTSFEEIIRSDNQQMVSVALEKVRMMYELGIKEDELTETFKIQMPGWEPRKEVVNFYNKCKDELIYEVKKYNKSKKLSYLYAEEDEKKEWLRGPFNYVLVDFIDKHINGSELPDHFHSREDEIRFILFSDEQVPLEEKTIVDENTENSYVGKMKKAVEMMQEKEMEFKITPDLIYERNEIAFDKSNYGCTIFLKGENDVEIIIRSTKGMFFYMYYGFLSEKRVDLLKEYFVPFTKNIKVNKTSKYRTNLFSKPFNN